MRARTAAIEALENTVLWQETIAKEPSAAANPPKDHKKRTPQGGGRRGDQGRAQWRRSSSNKTWRKGAGKKEKE